MLLYESVALTAVAYFVLCGLAPWFRSKHGRVLYFGTSLAVYAPWFLVHVLHVPIRLWAACTAGAWVFACLLWIVFGVPWLSLVKFRKGLRRLITRRFPPKSELVDGGRRQVIASLALPAVSLSLGGVGSLGANSGFVVKHVELPLHDWPKALDGFRIGQITDVHIGDFVSVQTLLRAVEVLNRSNVHLQAMTGDLIDDLTYLEPTFDALRCCRAPYGMLSILGNHEKMHSRLNPILARYAEERGRSPIRLLVDESEVIRHNGASMRVIGVDFPMRENGRHSLQKPLRMTLMQESAERAFAELPSNGEARICLSHHPEFFPFAAKRSVSVTLSGHTHGGQIAFLGQPLFPVYDYMLGHYQLGKSHLYVSGGTGHWLPYRVGVPTEVTVITLRSLGERGPHD